MYSRKKVLALHIYVWQNFVDVIKKAMISCETTGNIVTDHFTAGSKMVDIGSRAKRGVQDYYLSRLAYYLIAIMKIKY